MTDLCYNCNLSHLPVPCSKSLVRCDICHQLGHTWNFCHSGALSKQDYRFYGLCHNCDTWHLPYPCQKAPVHCTGCGEQGHLRCFCPVRPIPHSLFPDKLKSVMSKFSLEDTQSALHTSVFAEPVKSAKVSAVNDALFLAGKGYSLNEIRTHLYDLYSGHILPQESYPDVLPAAVSRPVAQYNSVSQQHHPEQTQQSQPQSQPEQRQRQDTNPQYYSGDVQQNGTDTQRNDTAAHRAYGQYAQDRREQAVTETQSLDPQLHGQASQQTDQPVDPASRAMIDAAIQQAPNIRTPEVVHTDQSGAPEAPTPNYAQSYDDEPTQPTTQGPYYEDTFNDNLTAYANSSVNGPGDRNGNGGMDVRGQSNHGLTSPGATTTSDAVETQDGDDSFAGNGHAT